MWIINQFSIKIIVDILNTIILKVFILLFLKNQSKDGAGIRFKFFRYFLVTLISIIIYL